MRLDPSLYLQFPGNHFSNQCIQFSTFEELCQSDVVEFINWKSSYRRREMNIKFTIRIVKIQRVVYINASLRILEVGYGQEEPSSSRISTRPSWLSISHGLLVFSMQNRGLAEVSYKESAAVVRNWFVGDSERVRIRIAGCHFASAVEIYCMPLILFPYISNIPISNS